MFKELDFPVELMDVTHPTLKGQTVPNQKHVVRMDTDEVLNTVSGRYPLVPHNDVFGAMEEAIANLGGEASLSFDHPVRTQMIDLAKAGSNEEILKRVSTPRSPSPLSRSYQPQDGSVSHAEAATVKMASAPRTSMMRYKQSTKSIPEIAAELGIDGVLTGTITREQDRFRITVQLSDARTDTHLWADQFDRELSSVLAPEERCGARGG